MKKISVTKRKDDNLGGLPPNSADWGKTSSSGLPPRHYTRLPLAGRIQNIGGKQQDTPESCLAKRGGKHKGAEKNLQ